MPNTRAPATRAAMPPTAPEVRAMRRISPNRLLRSDMLDVRHLDHALLPLPVREGARGRELSGSLLYCDQHKLQIDPDFAVRNAENANTLFPHPFVSHLVTRRIDVGDAVKFDHRVRGRTVEVPDVRAERDLPPKLQAAE